MMTKEELRTMLESDLQTLKKNKENVPIEELKTKYKKSYENLLNRIKSSSEEYLKVVIFYGILITQGYSEEYMRYIVQKIQDTNLVEKISAALYKEYSIAIVDEYATQIREAVIKATDDYYRSHLTIIVNTGAEQKLFLEKDEWKTYCPVNACYLIDNKWIPLEKVNTTNVS